MVSGTELKVLKALGNLGGKSHLKRIAVEAGESTTYTEMIFRSLGRSDYIDLLASGLCELTAKGYRALRASGWRSTDDNQGEETEEASGPIGADRFLSGWRHKLERGEITREEYQQKRTEIIMKMARGVEQP